MGERKVLNKFVPWDFDPKKLPRGKKKKDRMCEVRMMLPCSIRCKTCGEFMGQGKKFNSRKEEAKGEDYHGIKIWRFYMKCAHCSAVFTIKTDPEHDDYIVETGATRNFQLWRAAEEADEEGRAAKAEEEKYDAMRALENRTSDSKRQMDVLDALDEIRARNRRNAKLDPTKALQGIKAATKRKAEEDLAAQEAEDDKAARRAFKKQRKAAKKAEKGKAAAGAAGEGGDGAGGAAAGAGVLPGPAGIAAQLRLAAAAKAKASAPVSATKRPKFVMRKRVAAAADNAGSGGSKSSPARPASAGAVKAPATTAAAAAAPAKPKGGLGLGLGYASDSDTDSS